MAWDITDASRTTIEIDNGWYTLVLPKFTIWMVVDEPYITIYWADSQKGSKGITRSTGAIDYDDITFGYASPTSATDAMILIERMIDSAWDIDTSVTTDGIFTSGDGAVSTPVTLTAKSKAAINVFNYLNFI